MAMINFEKLKKEALLQAIKELKDEYIDNPEVLEKLDNYSLYSE